MKTIGVLGAGISGLSIGKLLNKDFEIEILEKDDRVGGIAKTKTYNNATYHPIGGHCFNSKYPDVLEFIFENVMHEKEWHKVTRKANIIFQGMDVPYPIEFAIKDIFKKNSDLAMQMTSDFLNSEDTGNYLNLADWFKQKFGNTLTDKYFIPYNTKIWGRSPNEMSHEWVQDKLPIPNKKSFFNALLSNEKDNMPHATFYYPNTNNQNTFIKKLADNLNIVLNYKIKNIRFESKRKKWIVNNDREYDILINTLPLNIIPNLVENTPEDVIGKARKLKYNKVTTMFWETAGTENTWTYIPDSNNIFHRYIHIGSFFNPIENFSITESIGEKSYEEMKTNGLKDPFLIKPLAYNVSDHAYVVFDENTKKISSQIKEHLSSINIYTLGRFGEWEYYNMDICMKKSIELSKKIIKIYANR